MATLFLKHRVRDYDEWRKVYDKYGAFQKENGITSAVVYRGEDDPDDVTVVHEFASLEAARAFAGNADLKAAMGAAGIVGEPLFWITART
jgi:heme-degrading monooxygenase HmoA